MPPGLLVRGTQAQLAAAFDRIAPLQPVRWTADGVVCAPRAAPGVSGADIAAAGLDTVAVPQVPGWPAPPSGWIAGWYHRAPGHVPAPPGVRELVLVDGEGFGTAPHPTTGLCLAAVDDAPDADAWDLGCGAGLLSQAWVAARGGRVDAVEVDTRALAQAAAAAGAAGRAGGITFHAGTAQALRPHVTGRVVLANLPPVAHRVVAPALRGTPVCVIAAGFRERDTKAVCALYAALGVAPAELSRAGGWVCVTLRPGA